MSCAQEKVSNKDVRVQGYLFTITSLKEPVNDSLDTSYIKIDNPERHFFIPLNDMQPTFKKTLEQIDNFKSMSLYLPLSLTESENSIKSTTSNLKSYLKNDSIKLSQINEYNNFYTKSKTTIEVESDKINSRIYNVIYIDGIWESYKVPFKWTEALSIGRYRSNSLDKSNKEGYDYYFLKSINVISYKLDIKEEGISVLDDRKDISLIHEATHSKKN